MTLPTNHQGIRAFKLLKTVNDVKSVFKSIPNSEYISFITVTVAKYLSRYQMIGPDRMQKAE